MENEYLYGIIGLLVGVLVMCGFCLMSPNCGMGRNMHKMSSGGMMKNSDMMGMNHQMDAMSASLQGKTGDAFDSEFLTQMIVHHEGAVSMAKEVLKVSKRPELIKLANEIITAQEKEISQMEEWQQAWF